MIKIKLISKTIATAMLGVLLFTACDNQRVYEKNTELPDYVWDKNNILKFTVDIQDTISSHNVFVNIRNASSYQYNNLFLFVTTRAPKGGILKDTIELTLADDKGRWKGNGLGDIWDNQILYKRNVRFPFKGIYTFELEQAMRNARLPYIMDAGIRIEKAN
ncbi:MAG TPA: gliding motility lipoprotein GldH [Bacteroidales bacterium]|nr:gliding motility lipoprotein GldH [Bacteroidales bacterium]